MDMLSIDSTLGYWVSDIFNAKVGLSLPPLSSPLYSNRGPPDIKKFHFPQSTHQLKKRAALFFQMLQWDLSRVKLIQQKIQLSVCLVICLNYLTNMKFLLLLLHFTFMILAPEMKNNRNVGFILNAVVVNEKFFGPIFMTQT